MASKIGYSEFHNVDVDVCKFWRKWLRKWERKSSISNSHFKLLIWHSTICGRHVQVLDWPFAIYSPPSETCTVILKSCSTTFPIVVRFFKFLQWKVSAEFEKVQMAVTRSPPSNSALWVRTASFLVTLEVLQAITFKYLPIFWSRRIWYFGRVLLFAKR